MNKEKICELVQKINDILYNEMGITSFKERVILLGCTAIVEKEKISESANTIKCWLNGNNTMPQNYYDNGLMYSYSRKRKNTE